MAAGRDDLLHALQHSEEGRQRLAAAHRYAQVGMCVSGVTHDINNQLGIIMAYAELLAMEHAGDAQLAQTVQEIVEGVKRSSHLLEDLTAVARKERSEAVRVLAGDIVQRVINLRLYDIKVAGVRWEQCIEAPSLLLLCDRPRLEQALLYLMSNALEAALESDQPSMRLSLTHEEDAAVFTVWDSGPGIEAAMREACFEPFVTTKGIPHLGMGLFAARRVAEMHEGRLTYEPAVGMRLSVPLCNGLVDSEGRDR